MPTLKQITCSVQLGPSDTKLKEYGHRFTDGGVEAFIAVPDTKIPFNVRVTSSGYIAPGLAAYVFMDGQYQCNRNRQRLQLPAPGMSTRDYEVDFRLRQKEEKTAEGTFVAREWTFAELKTGNADRAPDTNPAFAKNVGTIEVVILRCKGDATHDPAETVIDGGDTTGLTTVSKAPSVVKSAPAEKARSSTKPSSKAPSKAPSKAATKGPSAAADDGFGMFGLFDGAGDHPNYTRRMPGYYGDRSPLPRYRWEVRDDDRYSTRPFTVHGGQGNHDRRDPRAYPHNTRPQTANEQYRNIGAPYGGYDFHQRRGFVTESVQQSPMPRRDPPYHNTHTPGAPPSSLMTQDNAPEGFPFILDVCKEIEGLFRLSFGDRQKYEKLMQEVQQSENDPELHLSAMKALRQKEQELRGLDEELAVMRQSIYARMRRMNPKDWQYTRDFLVLKARLFGMNDPQMQQWPDPRLQQNPQSPEFGMTRTSGAIDDRTGPNPRSDDGWQEQGQGETGGGLQQKQMRKQSGAHSARSSAQKPADDGWGASSPQKDDGWANDAIDEQAEDNNQGGAWGAADSGEANGAWGGDSSSKKADNNDNWNNNDTKGDSNNGGAGGWGGDDKAQANNDNADGWNTGNDNNENNGSKAKPNGWGNDGAASQKSGSKKDGWGGGGNDNAQQDGQWDNKSQTAKSKVALWNNGSKKSEAAAGWGSQSKAKSQGGGGGWEQVGAGEAQARSHASSRRPARTTTSAALEPVIKPYWADWNKPQQDTVRPRVPARDPYEYPRAATVLAPAGRARDVSHGVQAGRGADYAHKTFRPEYLDTMDKPYAIFTFKYRSQAALEKILKRRIDTSDTKRAVDEAEKEKLMRLPKDELVQEMLKMRLNPPRSGSKSASAAKPASNTGWGGKAPSQANQWGGDQQRDDIKPGDSVSQQSSANRSNRGGGGDAWGADDRKASSGKSKANGGDAWGGNAGGGDAWDKQSKGGQKSDRKGEGQKAKTASAWGATPAAGGDNSWGAPAAGGGGAWDDAGKDKASSKSEEHFAGDPNLKTAGNAQEAAEWAGAGW